MQLTRTTLLRALPLVIACSSAVRADDTPAPATPTPTPAPATPAPEVATPPMPAPDSRIAEPAYAMPEQTAYDTSYDTSHGDGIGGDERPVTGTLRGGVYANDDRTVVLRGLGVVSKSWEHWSLDASLGVDSVTSASVDVRSSPQLSEVDVVTSASGRSSTSGGEMTDTRAQLTGGVGWKGEAGAAVNLTSAVATEADYTSVSGGLNGSFDLLDRQLTLLAGGNVTDNWVSSILDRSLHEKMYAVGWSTGLAFVSSPLDAWRLRYDGNASFGYLASPYRNVRFGDWTPVFGDHQITFLDTIGSSDGLPERLPDRRIRHAVVLEWLHSLAPGLGLHPEARVSRDSWNVRSLTAGLDLRFAADAWRVQIGYRFYLQSHARFFEDKYTLDPMAYTYYTSDKELGDEVGHLVELDLAFVLSEAHEANESRTLLNLQIEGAHYGYPGFILLPSRQSVFATIGLTWEL